MSKEERARNALKDGARAEKFACFIPPHEAVLCNEDRDQYESLVEDLIAIYKPLNQAVYAVIGDMAAASAEMLAGNALVPKMNREIDRLQQTLARAERRIKFIHANFPDFAPARHKRTEAKEEETVANEGLNETEPEKDENDLPPIFTSENVPAAASSSSPTTRCRVTEKSDAGIVRTPRQSAHPAKRITKSNLSANPILGNHRRQSGNAL